ncbi:MAG: hypothetical protein ACFFDO_02150 [Candidatus Thorarchaeota archaeon]
MKSISLTKAYIQNIDDPTNVNLNISISDKIYLKNNPYLLVIQTNQENCARLTIYPVKVKSLIKVSLFGLKTSVNTTSYSSLSKTFQKFDIIHTSGLIIKENELYYECYLNLSLSDVKTKVLKVALNKIKNIFKEILIEEICLK